MSRQIENTNENANNPINAKPLISVIVPVYNTEKWLTRCLNSITSQSYKNLEIIVVDDASPDNSSQIITGFTKLDKRVKCIKHEQNKGLFQARISGLEVASGKYFAFVDSDDYISIDWFRILIKTAEQNNADITIGDTILEDYDGQKKRHNLDELSYKTVDISGDAVLTFFMSQAGTNYFWHVVWNKLYRADIIKNDFERIKQFSLETGRLIMCEDIAYSSVFWANAHHAVSAHGANYIYFKTQAASTNVSNNKNPLQTIKNVASAFNFFEHSLLAVNRLQELNKHFIKWKNVYANLLYRDYAQNPKNIEYEKSIRELFGYNEKFIGLSNAESTVYRYLTNIENCCEREETIKKQIMSESTSVVSFDIFDTLIVRPFIHPTDLFSLLNTPFNDIFTPNSYINFAQIRIQSEQLSHKRLKATNPNFEDVTLYEIYNELALSYGFDRDKLEILMQKEIELEEQFCYERKFGKELYQLALDSGKKVVLCSDMYLPLETIKHILDKNGYIQFDKLYLSSDIKLGKYTKNLYRYMLKDLRIKKPEEVTHIGDNLISDVNNAKKVGIIGLHIPKSIDIYKNTFTDWYTGNAFNNIWKHPGDRIDTSNLPITFNGISYTIGLIANKLFDNPFKNYNTETDLDINPYTLGYSVLGPALLALLEWIADDCQNKDIENIHFVARDGWLPMKGWEIMSKYRKNIPKANYLYVSRKSLAIFNITSKTDIYSLINTLNIKTQSPSSLIQLFSCAIPKEKLDNITAHINMSQSMFTQKFSTREEYDEFIKFLANSVIDFNLLNAYQQKHKDYFSSIIKQNDILFDIGYSGTTESTLSTVLNYPINSYYIHSNSNIINYRMNAVGFVNKCFYNYKPAITGVIREHMFMQLAPSTIGYKQASDGITPIFEEYSNDYATLTITETVQNSALQFVRDYYEKAGSHKQYLFFRYDDMAYPLEYYLHYSKSLDRQIFSSVLFEDDLGVGKTIHAVNFWNKEINRLRLQDKHNTNNATGSDSTDIEAFYSFSTDEKIYDLVKDKSKLKKIICYLLLDSKLFWAKVRAKRKNRKRIKVKNKK